MSSRDLHYYEDYVHPVTKHRKRLWYRSGIAGTRAIGTRPAWGATGNSAWKQLPRGFLKGTSSGAFGYDALPIGLFDPPTKSFVLDLQLLYASGDADHANVATYITEGRGPGATYLPDGVNPADRTIDTRNLYAILTDKGDASIGIADFSVEYLGAQDISLEETLKIKRVAGVVIETIYEAKTINLARVCLGEILPVDLYRMAGAYTHEVESWIYGCAYHTSTWDLNYLHVYGNPPGWTDHERQNFWIYEIADIWDMIAIAATNMLKLLTGLTSVTWSWGYKTSFPTLVGPMTTLVTTGQTLEGVSSVSDATDTSGAYGLQDRFVGIIDRRDNTRFIGGWFHHSEPDGAWRFDHIWEMLQSATEGCGARARITMDYQGTTVMTFESLRWAETKSVGTQLQQTDAPVMRKGVIGGATGDVIGGETMNFTVWGTKESNRRTIPMWFTTGAQVAGEGDIDGTEISSDAGFDVISGNVVGVYQIRFPVNLLIRYQQPTNASRAVPMVVHHNVGVRYNAATDITADCLDDAGDLPEPNLTQSRMDDLINAGAFDGSDFPPEGNIHVAGSPYDNPYAGLKTYQPLVKDYWWRPYRAVRLAAAKRGGIPYAVGALVGNTFSKWTQYGMPMTLQYSDVMLEDLGVVLDISMASTAPNFAGLTVDPYVVSGTVDDGAGTVAVETIGPGA